MKKSALVSLRVSYREDCTSADRLGNGAQLITTHGGYILMEIYLWFFLVISPLLWWLVYELAYMKGKKAGTVRYVPEIQYQYHWVEFALTTQSPSTIKLSEIKWDEKTYSPEVRVN